MSEKEIVSTVQESAKMILRPVYTKKESKKLLEPLYDFDHYEIYGKVLKENVDVKEYQSTANTNISWDGAVITSLMNAKLNKDVQKQAYLILNQKGQEEVIILSKLPFLVEGIGEVKAGEVKNSRSSKEDPCVEEKSIQITTYKDGSISFNE